MFLAKARYCTGQDWSRPHSMRMRSRSSARAPGSASRLTGSPVSLITAKMVRLRMNSVISAYQVRRMMKRVMTAPRFGADLAASSLVGRRGGFLQLDVFPRIGVAGGEVCRENILPFRRRQPRPDRVDEGVPEHRHKVIVFQDFPLNVFSHLLALVAVGRS